MRAAGELADFEEGWRLVIRIRANVNLTTIPIVPASGPQ
ncbi:hypothetical protein Mnod_3001 [Methylobacterium nodulans ORS 2060]|uniref:Uncharacterized protein n=1 Tax=Methylobacterium nodulans (strain LMG 21967 / CNCM I-2342 / ORS 2060) TaxID=460265 RepID=B8II76_METNO|nr:hypothetical protein Mnod_3001 [Methylobacterium nodulans ORS 2060]